MRACVHTCVRVCTTCAPSDNLACCLAPLPRSMVHEIVGRINGQFGTLTYVPIYHLDTSLSFTELCALYAVTDVALVTSLVRDIVCLSFHVLEGWGSWVPK